MAPAAVSEFLWFESYDVTELICIRVENECERFSNGKRMIDYISAGSQKTTCHQQMLQ